MRCFAALRGQKYKSTCASVLVCIVLLLQSPRFSRSDIGPVENRISSSGIGSVENAAKSSGSVAHSVAQALDFRDSAASAGDVELRDMQEAHGSIQESEETEAAEEESNHTLSELRISDAKKPQEVQVTVANDSSEQEQKQEQATSMTDLKHIAEEPHAAAIKNNETNENPVRKMSPPMGLNEFRKKMVPNFQRTNRCGNVEENSKGVRHRLEPGGQEYNFAAASHGAKLVAANSEAKGSSSILHNDKEKYYRSPCSAEEKFVVVELSEETLVDVFVVANFELYSSNPKDFELFGSLSYPTEDWRLLGRFEAENARHSHRFRLPKPEWARYLKLQMISHYGGEFFCTLSMIEVYGIDAIECLLEEWVGNAGAGNFQQDPLQVPTSFGGRELKTTADHDDDGGDKSDRIRNIIDTYVQPSRLGDSVMKLLMQKVKALEMNQNLFDRYVEELNFNYRDHFNAFERDLEATNKVVRNLSSSLSSLVTLIHKTETEWERNWDQLQSKFSDHVEAEDARLEFIKNQIQHMQHRESVATALALMIVAASILVRLLRQCFMSFRQVSLDLLLVCSACLFIIILSA